MARTKGAKNKAPTLSAHIYVRCHPDLKKRLARVMKGKSESQKVVTIVTAYLQNLDGMRAVFNQEEKGQ
jgi:hypothetical protein